MEHNDSGKEMKPSDPALRTTLALYAIILILPFLMFHWMVPFVSDWILGNDYQYFPIQHQMELMFSLETGSFPLYVPGFAGGQSASALTLGQVFHPIPHIAALLPGYWSGKALEWNTLLRLLSLGGAHLALFAFLWKLRLGGLMALTLSTLTVYNFQLANFHIGAGLESWTGHLLLCAAIGWYCLKPTKWRGPLCISGSTYWLICSGHPEVMYYGLLGAGLFTLVVPYFVAMMLPYRHVDIRNALRFWIRVGLCCGAGIALSSAYVLPFYFDFVSTNAEHAGQGGYAWADTDQDTFMGTLNGFFLPLRSMTFFGGSSLFLAAALVPVLRLFQVRVPRVVWVVWGLALVAFLHIQGARTPVHYFAWKYLPLASSIRIAARISLIMPILFMMALAWVMRAEPVYLRLAGKAAQVAPRTILALAALLLIGLYAFIPDSIVSDCGPYSPANVLQIPPWVEPLVLLLGAAALAALVVHGSLPRAGFVAGLLLCLVTCTQIMGILRYGLWVDRKKDTPTLVQMLAEKRERLEYWAGVPGYGMDSRVVRQQVERSFLEPFLGKVYGRYLVAEDNEKAYALMEQGRAPDQVVVEQYVPEPPGESQAIENAPDRVKLTYSSFNRLVFDVSASGPGFFGLAYPYTGHWKAFVNTREVSVYRANGAAHAVRVPGGRSLAEFRYWSPAAFWGMILSCATFALIGIVFSLCALKNPLGLLVGTAFLIMGAGGFALWYHSLYSGDNLGTEYVWKPSPPAPLPNLAYGKQTKMSSRLYKWQEPFLHSSGRAVDGDHRPGSGSITGLQLDPWWMVDLHRPEPIGSIVIYGCPWSDPTFNTRALVVALSNDKEEWVGTSTAAGDYPRRLMFNQPRTAQYVLVKAPGTWHLAIDEVEIYPPPEKDFP